MGKSQRDKGLRFEQSLVRDLQSVGVIAQRVPLSGSAGGEFSGDIRLLIRDKPKIFEAKIRQSGFREIYRWLANHDGLFIRADRQPALAIIRLDDFASLVRV